MKWGLFGGTFDPIHTGHLRCAEEVLEIFDLNRIIFVPASRPPHKLDAQITPFHHREQMVKLAIEENPCFSFSDVENQREGKSYSVETIEYFLEKYLSDLELYMILGQDAFHAIKTWRDWEKLLLLCNFVIMTRPGYINQGLSGIIPPDFAALSGKHPHPALPRNKFGGEIGKGSKKETPALFNYDEDVQGFRGPTGHVIFFREVTFLDISASNIRQRVNQEKSIKYLVPDAVRRYIAKNGLYKNL